MVARMSTMDMEREQAMFGHWVIFWAMFGHWVIFWAMFGQCLGIG